jgi:hypothetical protein
MRVVPESFKEEVTKIRNVNHASLITLDSKSLKFTGVLKKHIMGDEELMYGSVHLHKFNV